MAQTVKNPPAMMETLVQSLGQEDLLEKGMATHSGILAWRIPQTEESGGYSAYKLNKQGDNIQPCGTPLPIWNQSVVPCPVLTVAS